MKVEDYKFIVNDKEVSTIEEWFKEFKKLSRTEFAFEESKNDVYKKIEEGVHRLALEIKITRVTLTNPKKRMIKIQRKGDETMGKRFFMDDYILQNGNPNSKEYKQALGRLELEKLDRMKSRNNDDKMKGKEYYIGKFIGFLIAVGIIIFSIVVTHK